VVEMDCLYRFKKRLLGLDCRWPIRSSLFEYIISAKWWFAAYAGM